MARRTEHATDDPLKLEVARLARTYGDQEVLRICLWTIQQYAELGARQASVKRSGNPATVCDACREREALTKQLESTLKRVSTTRPQGGAAPSQTEEE